jgi:hypothetical protein
VHFFGMGRAKASSALNLSCDGDQVANFLDGATGTQHPVKAKSFRFGRLTAECERIFLAGHSLINEMTGGQALSISLADGAESNRLKKLAEDVLGGKRAMTDQEIVAARKKYSD